MAAEGTALFKAIADFSRYRREAKAAAGATREWKRETRGLNAELAATDKASTRTATKLNKLGEALAKIQGSLEKIQASKLGQELDKLADPADRLVSSLGKLDKATDKLTRTNTRAARSTRAVKDANADANAEIGDTATASEGASNKLDKLGAALSKVDDKLQKVAASPAAQKLQEMAEPAEKLASSMGKASAAADGLDKVAAKSQDAARGTKQLKDAATQANQELGDTERSSDRASSKLGRLTQSVSRLAGHLEKVKSSQAGQQLDKMAKPAGKLFAALGKIGAGVAGLSLVGSAAAASTGGVLSLLAAVVSLTGALGAVPAVAAAGLAAVGTIAVGMIGIADAFKETSGAAGGMEKAQRSADRAALQGAEQVRSARQRVADAYANGARRIADAERAVARAQREEEDAQRDLTDARADATEQLEDLQLALRGGQLDEKSATLRLKRAQQELQKVIQSGVGGLDLEEAVLGVEEAQLALDEAKERYTDLQQESEKANKAGVDGAENVIAAQRRVADAAEGTADAQQALTDARTESARDIADAERDLAMAIQEAAWAQEDAADSMVSAAGKAAPALAASAQAFVNAIKSMSGRFDQLRLGVQEKLFAGLGDRVLELANDYFPLAERSMGSMATTFNGMAHDFADWLSQKDTIDDFSDGLSNVEKMWENVRGATKPALQSMLDVFVEGSKLLPEFGKQITSFFESFAAKVREARESGALGEWIRNGIEQLKSFIKSVFNLGRALGSVFKAGEDAGVGFFTTLERITDQMADFLASAEGQDTLKKIFKAGSDAGKVLVPILKSIVGLVGDVTPILVRIAEKLGPGVVKLIDGLGDAFKTAEPALIKAGDAIGDFLGAVGDAGPLVGELVDGLITVLKPALDVLTALIKLVTSAFNALPEPMQDVIGFVGGLGIAIVAFLVIGVKFLGWLSDVAKGAKDAIKFVGELADKIKKTQASSGGPDLDADGKKKPGTGTGKGVPFEMDADASRKSGEKAGDAAADGAKKGFDKGWKSRFGSLAKGLGVIGIVIAVDEATDGGIAGVLDDLAGFEDAATRAKDTSEGLMGSINRLLEVPPAKPDDPWDMRNLPQTIGKAFDELNKSTAEKTTTNTLGIAGWWTTLSEKFSDGWTTLGSTWDTGWRGLTDTAWFNQGSMSTSTTLWLTEMGVTLDEKTQGFQDVIGKAWDAITGKNDTTWSDVQATIGVNMSDAALSLDESTGGMLTRLGDFGTELYGDFKSAWDSASETVRGWGRDVKSAIDDAVDWAGRQWKKLNEILSGPVSTTFTSGFNGFPKFNKGGKVPTKSGRDQDDQLIAATGGEWMVPKEQTKKWEPFLRAITFNDGRDVEPFAADDPLSRVANGASDGGFGGFAPVAAPRVKVAAKDGTTVGDVHVTQVVNNPLPEKASVTASKRIGRLARHGLVHAVGSVSA